MAMRTATGIRPRGTNVSRIEGFSDAVFGFALTLLVVALEVPRDFDDLMATMRGLPAFAMCFAIFLWIWWEHHQFFRRFGLGDGVTVMLNALLLFVVVLYVYPLKFVFSLVAGLYLGGPAPSPDARPVVTPEQVPTLMVVYAAGFLAVFGIFALMYARAWARRDALALTARERHLTKSFLRGHVLAAGIGALALVLAVAVPGGATWSGLAYFLLGPVLALNGILGSRSAPPA